MNHEPEPIASVVVGVSPDGETLVQFPHLGDGAVPVLMGDLAQLTLFARLADRTRLAGEANGTCAIRHIRKENDNG
jgi:hypothetical protein